MSTNDFIPLPMFGARLLLKFYGITDMLFVLQTPKSIRTSSSSESGDFCLSRRQLIDTNFVSTIQHVCSKIIIVYCQVLAHCASHIKLSSVAYDCILSCKPIEQYVFCSD
jgi:hypothetical protein